MNCICKLFSHKWKYFKKPEEWAGFHDYRECKKCGKTQQYAFHVGYWKTVVQSQETP